MKLEFSLDRFSIYTRIQTFMKIRTVGADLFHVDGHTNRQTVRMKPRVAFRNFTKAPKKNFIFTNNINNIWDLIKLRIKVGTFWIIQRATERFIMSEVSWRSTWHYSRTDVEI
jgi:hypothetical protein